MYHHARLHVCAGVRMRNVQCMVGPPNGNAALASSATLCTDAKPADTETCNTEACIDMEVAVSTSCL
jgi:hypothetical protein